MNIDASVGSPNHNIIGRAILEVFAESCTNSSKKSREQLANIGVERNEEIHAGEPTTLLPEAPKQNNPVIEANVRVEENGGADAPETNPRHEKLKPIIRPNHYLDPASPVSAVFAQFAKAEKNSIKRATRGKSKVR